MVSISGHTTVVLFLAMRSNNGGIHPVMTATRSQDDRQFNDNITTVSTNSHTLKNKSQKPFRSSILHLAVCENWVRVSLYPFTWPQHEGNKKLTKLHTVRTVKIITHC
jgi:hypothetical protein